MLEPFEFAFVTRAFLAGVILAGLAPLIGGFLVVKRYSLLAETLGHTALFGVALGLMLGVHPLLTALITAILTALILELLRSHSKEYPDALLALLLWGGLGGAVILFGQIEGAQNNVMGYLFGNIATVGELEIMWIAALAIVGWALIAFFYRDFFAISLDEELARVNGLKVKRTNLILVLLASLTIGLSMRVTGVFLVGALMVIPFLGASALGRGFKASLILAVVFAEIAVIGGLYSSYYWDLSPGGAIVMASMLLFLIAKIKENYV